MSLSDKIQGRYDFDGHMERSCYTPEDVKESIKELRAELKDPKLNCFSVDKIIDKVFGKKLSANTKETKQ